MEIPFPTGRDPKEVCLKVLNEILEAKLLPILVTTTDSFDISPTAVRDLTVTDNGIAFKFSKRGTVLQESFLWEDVLAIEAGEDLNS